MPDLDYKEMYFFDLVKELEAKDEKIAILEKVIERLEHQIKHMLESQKRDNENSG